jgi:L-ribulokinase
MASLSETRYRPRPENRDAYDVLYGEYLRLHDLFGRGGDEVMRRLRRLRDGS